MSDMITMTAEQLRARDMQVVEATERKLIAGGYVALTKAQITDVVASVETPQVLVVPTGHCAEGDRCVCGGDLPRIREGCGHWRKGKQTVAVPEGYVLVRGDQIAHINDLALTLTAENQKRLEAELLRDQLVVALENAVRLLRAAGYAMSGTATTPMLATIAAAKAAQHGALIDEGSKQPASTPPVAEEGTHP